ncbi:hypothetical protein [Alienimonas chondri]|uniref:DUF3131 domain-containing protein n=1 Tax=Alienimonas chondri TaxID=2681879 RepID=A0ABX1VFS6_9PLAN|nr:hypothetical protein [Alienimonas chondri]NNJ26688.1 hypothetical protein [Alienimonas chondri]
MSIIALVIPAFLVPVLLPEDGAESSASEPAAFEGVAGAGTGESVVTDRGALIYGADPPAEVVAPVSAVLAFQDDAEQAVGDTMSGPAPTPQGADAVPAALDSLAPLRPGLSDQQYYEALAELVLPNGLVLDRNSDPRTVSSAATGLVGYALAVLAERGVADRTDVADHLRRGFETTRAANPTANRGWLSHFTRPDGTPKRHSEVSTIDTALFYAGLLKAAETLDLADLERDVRAAVDGVDVAWLSRDGVFLHGLEWPAEAGSTEPKIIPYTWNDTSEGAILYRLFGLPFRPATHRTDLPLFTYFYPLVLWPDWDEAGSGRTGGVAWNPAEPSPANPNGGDVYRYEGPDYRLLLAAAMAWQHKTLGHAGVTAADGPGGYTAFRPTLVSPLMLSSLAPRFVEAADTLRTHDLDATLPAYDLDAGWDAPDRLAIDYASYFLLRAAVIEPGFLPSETTNRDPNAPSLVAEVE